MAYVYIISETPYEGETSGPWTKIGYSKNPPQWRMNANLKRGNPRSIQVAAAFEYPTQSEARTAEREAHEHFAESAGQNGKEWFNVSADQVERWFLGHGVQKVDTSEL